MKQFTSKTQKIGAIGETIAATYLKKQGFEILEQNVSNKFGELDLVAKKQGTVHFFEVKAGYAGSWFNPAENFTPAKIRKVAVSAEHYALVHHIKDYRISGVSVLIDRATNEAVAVEILAL